VERCRSALDALRQALPQLMTRDSAKEERETEQRLRSGGVPAELANRIALLPSLARASDVVPIAADTGRGIAESATAFFAVAQRFGFDRLDRMVEEIAPADYYEGLALQKARDSLEAAQRNLACGVLAADGGAADIAGWERAAGGRIAATAGQVEKILSDRKPSMAKVTVAASLLSELARS
jgi:glutamate dehydrogenase